MQESTLQFLWYIVFMASMFAYAALDGFDIGVGCLHLFTRQDLDRRIFMNAIGPVWDSNSLWVVITGGVLLAGFPPAFSTLLSALYIPIMVLLFCYTYRAVAIEFRSKMASPKWRALWDVVFSLASLGLAFGLGVFLANLIRGLPIDDKGNFVKDLGELFSPYALLVGLFAVCLFMLHGSLYLQLKTEGNLNVRMRRWSLRLIWVFAILWSALNCITYLFETHVTESFAGRIELYSVALLGLAALCSLYYCLEKRYAGIAFVSCGVIILSLVLLLSIGTYPNLVRSNLDPAYSLTIYNASSTPLTLKILLGMACAGVPLFLFYMSYLYKTFRGKVRLDTMSY